MTAPRFIAIGFGVSFLLLSTPAFACPVCFGAGEGPLASASAAGVAVLFGVTALMLTGFALFFVRLWRLSRASLPDEAHGRAAVPSEIG